MSSIKTELQSEMDNRYCTNWFKTIINLKKKKKKMEKKNHNFYFWLTKTNKYSSASVDTHLCGSKWGGEMSGEGKVLAAGGLMTID